MASHAVTHLAETDPADGLERVGTGFSDRFRLADRLLLVSVDQATDT